MMKGQKTFFVLILLASFQICFGQEKPEAILIDDFFAVPCDDFLSRADNFFSELQNSPDSQDYAVVYGPNEDLRRKADYELLIKGAIREKRLFNQKRITLIRGGEAENVNIKFWRIPPGATKPDFKEAEWDFVFPPQARPFIFYDDRSDGICPPTPFETIYVEYLKANPQALGNIVINSKSFKKYTDLKKKAQNLLKDISKKRLRFFHIKYVHSDKFANVEYWLLPQKKK